MTRALWAAVGIGLALNTVHATNRPGAAIDITHAWSRPTPPGASTGAIYLDITNRGSDTDQLIALSSPAARSAQVHQSLNVDGMMQMRPVAVLVCPPRATVKIEPGGLHIMLLGLNRPLSAGTEFPLTLHFRNAGDVAVSVRVGEPEIEP